MTSNRQFSRSRDGKAKECRKRPEFAAAVRVLVYIGVGVDEGRVVKKHSRRRRAACEVEGWMTEVAL